MKFQGMNNSLNRRLDEATSRSVIGRILDDCEVQTESDHGTLETVLSYYEKLLQHLTAKELSERLGKIASSSNGLHSIPMLTSKLSTHIPIAQKLELCYMVTEMIKDKLPSLMYDSMEIEPNGSTNHLYTKLVTSSITVLDKIQNCYSPKLANSIEIDKLIRGTIHVYTDTIISCIENARRRLFKELDVNLSFVSMFVAKGRNLLQQDCVSLLERVLKWLESKAADPLLNRIAERIFTDESYGIREHEDMLVSIIEMAEDENTLKSCLGYSLNRKGSVQRVVTARIFLQCICERKVVSTTIEYILSAGGKEMFLKTFKNMLSTWADPAQVKYTKLPLQKYTTIVVLEMAKRVNPHSLGHEWEELFLIIMCGLNKRMSSSDLTVRQMGMFVAETCSKLMSEYSPRIDALKFDYIEEPFLDEMRSAVAGLESPPVEDWKKYPTQKVPICLTTKMESLDIATSSVPVLDSDDEFEEMYVPKAEKMVTQLKENEEPAKKCEPPHYIKDAMERLGNKEKYEVFESAFFVLDDMIRGNAVGFKEISYQLVITLIYLNDNFSTKDFEATRKSLVVSCIVMNAECLPRLCETMFSRNCPFTYRYLILQCILLAAKELSAPPAKAPKIQESKKEEEESVSTDPSNWRAVVDARIRAKTRRFAKGEARKPSKAANRFAPVATTYFYPLLKTDVGEHLKLKGDDSEFLARVLFTAADVLQCASCCPSVVAMATYLCTLVTPLRFHDNPFVQTAVLFCYFAITVSMPPCVFLATFHDSLRDWMEYASLLLESDNSSEENQKLARLLMQSLVDISNSEEKLIQ